MRNEIIDNLRGLCMLGVIGIHVGSSASGIDSFWLYTLLEVLSRYSIPMFFFISGYGLYCTDKEMLALAQGNTATTPSSSKYFPFLLKRLKSSGIPYLSWSLFYEWYFWLPVTSLSWLVYNQPFLLGYGHACYHLYFMVILLVFYITHPLWRALLKLFLRTSLVGGMTVVFLLQLALFYWSSHPNVNPETLAPWLKNLYLYRLNYIPLYYLFIYLLGALFALYWDKVKAVLIIKFYAVLAFYVATLVYMEGSAYYSFTKEHYDLLSLAFTYHQLSLPGLLYTIGSTIGFCTLLLHWQNKTNIITKAIALFSKHSMLMYFVHPLFLDLLTKYCTNHGIVLTTKKILFLYPTLVIVSLAASILITYACNKCRPLKLVIMGK